MNVSRKQILEAADWSFPIPIAYGPGRIADLAAICATHGMRKPLVVTDRGSRELTFINAALLQLNAANIQAQLFAEVSPNPTDADIDNGRACYVSGRHDGIIAMGGGSGMDAGKAISLVANNSHNIWAFDYDQSDAPYLSADDFPPLICIPTTAGTGAETESTAMVTKLEHGVKGCVWHAAHKPRIAILDPQLTLQLPANLTAWTGVDALVHAIEAYTVPAFHPACDGLALEAIRHINCSLKTAVCDGSNLEARAHMLVGSCLAGVAFLKGLGLVHAMSHVVGAVYDTHHGLTNAVLLPPVLGFNRPALGDKVAQMCAALELQEHTFDALYNHLVELLNELKIPDNLATLGVQSDRIGELARKAHNDAARATNARDVSIEEIESLFTEALHKVR